MKPDWKNAPNWGKWLAMEANGEWYWHELKPCINGEKSGWYTIGRCKYAGSGKNWMGSLEERFE